MAIKSDNTKGNPYHQEGTGKFTSADSGGESKPETVTQPIKIDLSGLFADDLTGNDDLDALLNEVEAENANKPKPVTEMSTQELLKEIGDVKERLTNNYGVVFEDDSPTAVFGHDLRLTCANLRQMDILFSKYKTYASNMKIVPFSSSGSTVAGVASTVLRVGNSMELKVNDSMVFNRRYFKTYEGVVAIAKANIGVGHQVKVSDEYLSCANFSHEFGHTVLNSVLLDNKRREGANSFGKYLVVSTLGYQGSDARIANTIMDDHAESCRQEIYEIYKADNENPMNYDSFVDSVSAYAKSSPQEWFAEAFCGAVCGNKTPIGDALNKFLEKKGWIKT